MDVANQNTIRPRNSVVNLILIQLVIRALFQKTAPSVVIDPVIPCFRISFRPLLALLLPHNPIKVLKEVKRLGGLIITNPETEMV